MISSIALIAVVAYILLPGAGWLWVRTGWKRAINRFKTEKRIAGICTAFIDGKLRIEPSGPEATGDFFVSPRHTLFFILRKNGEIERLDWKSVFLLQTGTTIIFIPATKRFIRGICIFYEEKNAAALSEQIQGLAVPGRISNPVRPYGIATGAFLEFLLFLASIRDPETGSAGIAALVAVFGVAIPWCPPGVLFTLMARSGLKKDAGTKKNRQRRVAGFLLVSAGVLLNIGVIFLVIRRIGF